MKHYVVAPRKEDDAGWLTACGVYKAVSVHSEEITALVMPDTNYPTCPECLNSQEFNDALLELEIGLDGNPNDWIVFWNKKEPK